MKKPTHGTVIAEANRIPRECSKLSRKEKDALLKSAMKLIKQGKKSIVQR